jgi:hypothetical protein
MLLRNVNNHLPDCKCRHDFADKRTSLRTSDVTCSCVMSFICLFSVRRHLSFIDYTAQVVNRKGSERKLSSYIQQVLTLSLACRDRGV